MPDDSMKLSPAGARRCLKDGEAAAVVPSLKREARAATSRANKLQGAKDQCDTDRKRDAVDMKTLTLDNDRLRRENDQLKKQRWAWFAGGTAFTATAVTILYLLLR